MILRGLLFGLIGASALSPPAIAQTVRVQSGDHDGFSRLVLPIGTDRDWTLEQDDDATWTLSVDPAIDAFDTSGAFDLIQRDRITGLEGGTDLILSLGCACDVVGFRFQDRYLVIDVSDAVEAEAEEEVTAEAAPEFGDDRADERAEAAAALPDLSRLISTPGLEAPSRPLSVGTTPNPHTPSEGDPMAALTEEGPNPRLAEAAQIMAEQLARAAASGLLDAALDQPQTVADPIEQPLPQVAPDAEDTPEHEVAETDARGMPTGPLPIHTENALETRLSFDLPFTPSNMAPGSCEGADIPIRDWSDGNGFEQALGGLRQALFNERDQLDQDAALELAQHYLRYGFGAEAGYWLAQMDDAPVTQSALADLFDGHETHAFPDVETTSECSHDELLWRVLAEAVIVELSADDVADIQRAFGALPAGLRDLTGPSLARVLMEEGHASSARDIRDALHRGGRIDQTTLRILDLDLGISPDSAPSLTREGLAEGLRDDGGDPVSVMAHALAFDRSQHHLPTPERLVAAEALLREAGPGRETDMLWREVLIGRAALGQIDRAMNMLADPIRSSDARTEALTHLIAERVSVNDTAALLILAYRYGPDWRPEGSTAGRAQIGAIAALREAGLYRAANILRDVRRPLILPAPEEDAEVPDPVAVAWENRDWAALAEVADGPHADIASRLVALSGEDPSGGTPSSLAELAASVADSADLRANVVALLNNPGLMR